MKSDSFNKGPWEHPDHKRISKYEYENTWGAPTEIDALERSDSIARAKAVGYNSLGTCDVSFTVSFSKWPTAQRFIDECSLGKQPKGYEPRTSTLKTGNRVCEVEGLGKKEGKREFGVQGIWFPTWDPQAVSSPDTNGMGIRLSSERTGEGATSEGEASFLYLNCLELKEAVVSVYNPRHVILKMKSEAYEYDDHWDQMKPISTTRGGCDPEWVTRMIAKDQERADFERGSSS